MISGLILMSVVPLLEDTGSILLQKVPGRFAVRFAQVLEDARRLQGVSDVEEPHLWCIGGNENVATVRLVVDRSMSVEREQHLVQRIEAMLQEKAGAVSTTVQTVRRGVANGSADNDQGGVLRLSNRRRVTSGVPSAVLVV